MEIPFPLKIGEPFDYERLEKAIAVREQSYQLLMWISDAINRGKIQPSRAARHSGGGEAAKQWIQDFYFDIPEDLRPKKSDIDEFAGFFSTYLTSSFTVVENPGKRGPGPVGTCWCDVCTQLVNAPHLQTKKLYARDKSRANILMEDRLEAFAERNALLVDRDKIVAVVTSKETRRSAAYITYGHWLVMRLEGKSDGPAILALWRMIAWDPRGGMRAGFTLKIEDFRSAEHAVYSALRGHT